MGTALLVSNVVLWLLLVLLALAVLALSRQIGLLHERIAPAGALMVEHGPKVGETAPVVTATPLTGEAVLIGGEHGGEKSTLAFFLSPNCPVCKTLLPVLKSARKSERRWLDIVLASDGDIAKQREFVREAGLDEFPYVVSSELGMTYRVGKL
ncbi:MAG: methylamine dehydrogenase accessory protein MauD, partial [Pseudomonadota bacterium]